MFKPNFGTLLMSKLEENEIIYHDLEPSCKQKSDGFGWLMDIGTLILKACVLNSGFPSVIRGG